MNRDQRYRKYTATFHASRAHPLKAPSTLPAITHTTGSHSQLAGGPQAGPALRSAWRWATGSRPLLRAAAAMLTASLLTAPARGEETTPARPSFERLRQDEDWSALCDPARRMLWLDAIKCVPLGAGRAAWLSIGGEVRERYEYTRNPLWGQDSQDKNGVFLQRYVLHGDLHLGPHLRLFGQIYSALEDGRAGPPSPIEKNRLDLQQVFLDLSTPLGAGASATLRVGRQELRYGSARLVDVREGPNVRRKFDGGRVRIEVGDWQLDGIAVRPSLIEPGVFNDRINDAQALWGAYAVARSPSWLPFGSSLDLYYLGYKDEAARFDQGAAQETRHTVGIRLWGERSGWDWNWEIIYQFGRFGRGDIRAWSTASDTGYTARDAPWSPRLGLSANVASGDRNPADHDLQTFNPLFPRGNYFSELALLGPRNFFNLHPSLTVQLTERLSLTADVDFFWRLEHDDGIYGPSGRLLRSGRESDLRVKIVERAFSTVLMEPLHPALRPVFPFVVHHTHCPSERIPRRWKDDELEATAGLYVGVGQGRASVSNVMFFNILSKRPGRSAHRYRRVRRI